MADELDILDIIDDEESGGSELIKYNAGIIPPLPQSASLTITEIQPTASLQEVRSSDLQINNVQMLSLLHGLQNVRTIDSLCKVNEQISKTIRYRRDILGLEREKEMRVPGIDHPLTPIE